jgi:hypothetical protein
MKDWKTWAIILLVGFVIFQYVELCNFEALYREDMHHRLEEINKVSADALQTRLDSSSYEMVQLNCAQVESSFKGWTACVESNLEVRRKK